MELLLKNSPFLFDSTSLSNGSESLWTSCISLTGCLIHSEVNQEESRNCILSYPLTDVAHSFPTLEVEGLTMDSCYFWRHTLPFPVLTLSRDSNPTHTDRHTYILHFVSDFLKPQLSSVSVCVCNVKLWEEGKFLCEICHYLLTIHLWGVSVSHRLWLEDFGGWFKVGLPQIFRHNEPGQGTSTPGVPAHSKLIKNI